MIGFRVRSNPKTAVGVSAHRPKEQRPHADKKAKGFRVFGFGVYAFRLSALTLGQSRRGI